MKNEKQQISFAIRLFMVGFVYTLQGAALEFLQYSVQTELVVNGASNSQLAMLSSMEFPWCLKLLWAPIQDAFFFSYLGRRKTWVFGTMVLLMIVWSILSIYINQMIVNIEVERLTALGIVTSFLLTSQDVSMDGWILKLSENEAQMAKFSWWCQFGYSFGGLLSFTLFIWLSSKDWCFRNLKLDHRLLDPESMVKTVAICFAIAGGLTLFLKEEKDALEINQYNYNQRIDSVPYTTIERSQGEEIDIPPPTNLTRVMSKLKNLIRNKYLIHLASFLLFSEVGFAYFENIGYVTMLKNGITEDDYATFWLVSTICEGFAGAIIAKYCVNRQMSIYLMGFILKLLNGFYYSLILYTIRYQLITQEQAFYAFGTQQCIMEISYAMSTVPMISFFLSICDTEVEGTYIAFLTTFLYTGLIWVTTFIYRMADIFDQDTLIFSSLGYSILYLMFFGRGLLKLQTADKSSWKLGTN